MAPLGRSGYILRLTIPPKCWNHVRQEKKFDYSTFILFSPATCHKNSLQLHNFYVKNMLKPPSM